MNNNSMNVMIEIVSFCISIFSTYIIFYFMKNFNRTLYHKKYIYIINFILFAILGTIGNIYIGGILSVFFIIMLIAVFGHFLFNDKKIYLIYYSIFGVFVYCMQIVFTNAFMCIYNMLNINFYNTTNLMLANSLVIQFANFGATSLFITLFKKKKIENLKINDYLSFLILPIFSISYITTMLMYMQKYLILQEIIIFSLNIVSIIFLNIFIIGIFEKVSKNNEMKNKISLYEQKNNMQYKYYNELETKILSSRKIIHDIKNHMQTIEALYKESEKDKAKKYVDDIYVLLDSFAEKRYSRNSVLNIIMNDKSTKAKQLDISIDSKIADVNLDMISDIDITTIFSNILDNAIEELENYNDEKIINLRVDKFNNFLVINISNKINNMPIKAEKLFKSTKKNHEGLGLGNVEFVVKKYNGNMKTSFDRGVFKLNIVIPLD